MIYDFFNYWFAFFIHQETIADTNPHIHSNPHPQERHNLDAYIWPIRLKWIDKFSISLVNIIWSL